MSTDRVRRELSIDQAMLDDLQAIAGPYGTFGAALRIALRDCRGAGRGRQRGPMVWRTILVLHPSTDARINGVAYEFGMSWSEAARCVVDSWIAQRIVENAPRNRRAS